MGVMCCHSTASTQRHPMSFTVINVCNVCLRAHEHMPVGPVFACLYFSLEIQLVSKPVLRVYLFTSGLDPKAAVQNINLI